MLLKTLNAISVELNDILKLRPSVAVVVNDNFTDFFISNIRKSIRLKMNKNISSLLFQLDGKQTIKEYFKQNNIKKSQQKEFIELLVFLNQNSILLKIDTPYLSDRKKYHRVFTLLEDFYKSKSEINNTFRCLKYSNVMIIGLGSVGTWVAQSLAMCGIQNFILVDGDTVDISNLHRQIGYSEKDIQKKKINVFSKYLKSINKDIETVEIDAFLTTDFFDKFQFEKIDLIINCADYPSVDKTSSIIGEYSMKRGINHIIGGGYNLHQSLIGQVVIPGETACVECFRLRLEKLNIIDTSNITKLANNRKIGSFPPLSSLSASITANEAFKVLTKLKNLSMTNNRTEFSVKSLDFRNIKMERHENCKWCGKEGKYYNL